LPSQHKTLWQIKRFDALAQKLAKEEKGFATSMLRTADLVAKKDILNQILKWFGDDGFMLLN
jgi:hypothetical protein